MRPGGCRRSNRPPQPSVCGRPAQKPRRTSPSKAAPSQPYGGRPPDGRLTSRFGPPDRLARRNSTDLSSSAQSTRQDVAVLDRESSHPDVNHRARRSLPRPAMAAPLPPRSQSRTTIRPRRNKMLSSLRSPWMIRSSRSHMLLHASLAATSGPSLGRFASTFHNRVRPAHHLAGKGSMEGCSARGALCATRSCAVHPTQTQGSQGKRTRRGSASCDIGKRGPSAARRPLSRSSRDTAGSTEPESRRTSGRTRTHSTVLPAETISEGSARHRG